MKKILFASLSILFLAAACNKQQAQVPPAQNQPVQTSPPAQQQPQATKTDETADWKTFTSDSLGLTFKYPKEWNEKNGRLVGRNEESMVKIDVSTTTFSSTEDWFNSISRNQPSNLAVQLDGKEIIGGYQWYRYSYLEGIGGCAEDYALVKDKELYILERGPIACDDNAFGQILKSFKFTK